MSSQIGLWSTLVLCSLVASVGSGGCAWKGRPLKTGLTDLAGVEVDPFSVAGSRAHVFLFLRTDCPISNRYAPEIKRLYREFSPRQVSFWLVYCDPAESAASVRRHMREYGYDMNALRDPRHEFVRLAGAQVTPEVAVYAERNGSPALLYRGRIDDRVVDFGRTRPDALHHDLREALSAILAGDISTSTTTAAVGCYISGIQ